MITLMLTELLLCWAAVTRNEARFFKWVGVIPVCAINYMVLPDLLCSGLGAVDDVEHILLCVGVCGGGGMK